MMGEKSVKKSFYKRWPHFAKASRGKWFWFIIAIIIAGVAVGYYFYRAPEANPGPNDVVITANLVDLSTIVTISKFRSCAGHEFGYTSAFDGTEVKSSLKHYFEPDPKYLGSEDAVAVYAPFDGKIIYSESDNNQFIIEQRPFAGWEFDFTHVDILSTLKEGSEVNAGEKVGYVNLVKTHAFDTVLSAQKKPGYKNYDWDNNYDSIFNHMSDAVYSQYVARGVTKDNIIIAKSGRDASPCECDPNNPPTNNSSYCNFPTTFDPNNQIELK